MNKPYPDGIDSVWLAIDGDGHIGAFVTGGAGPIPMQLLDFKYALIEETEERMCNLPCITGARVVANIPRPDDFIAMAERGFYAYDWTDAHRTASESLGVYEPVALPNTALTIDSLSEELAELAACVRLAAIRFADGKSIDIRAHMKCRPDH